jgi:hypothetical protein
MATFAEIVEAADRLSLDEQETLIELLQHRIAKRNRESLVRDVIEARDEFRQTKPEPSSVSEIMDEAKRES